MDISTVHRGPGDGNGHQSLVTGDRTRNPRPPDGLEGERAGELRVGLTCLGSAVLAVKISADGRCWVPASRPDPRQAGDRPVEDRR
jgi:hypothetical protein